MRIKSLDNGNIAVYNRQEVLSHRNPDNRSWLTSNNTDQSLRENSRDYSQVFNSNTIYSSRKNSGTIENTGTEIGADCDASALSAELVCNRQYRINSRNVNSSESRNSNETDNLEATTETIRAPCERFICTYFPFYAFLCMLLYVSNFPDIFIIHFQITANTNAYADTTPIDEERAFEHSDTDEMSENGIHPVPRGIVNPNYPGFQHLAHTLQVKFHLRKETLEVFKLCSLQRHKRSPSCYRIQLGREPYVLIYICVRFTGVFSFPVRK